MFLRSSVVTDDWPTSADNLDNIRLCSPVFSRSSAPYGQRPTGCSDFGDIFNRSPVFSIFTNILRELRWLNPPIIRLDPSIRPHRRRTIEVDFCPYATFVGLYRPSSSSRQLGLRRRDLIDFQESVDFRLFFVRHLRSSSYSAVDFTIFTPVTGTNL